MFVEYLCGAAILFGVAVLVRDVLVQGYLPSPFFHDKSDSFMDWYNPAYWAHNPGAYSEWFSVYPPLSFLFLDLFSRPSCFTFSPYQGRACDPQGYWVISIFLLINLVLLWRTYGKLDHRTAFPRAIAVGLGTSMLFGWERANLIIPCFTCLVLAYGNILKNSWAKIIFAALAVNFKPYLILAAFGRLFRLDWRWSERFVICCGLIYMASFAIFGAGTPMEILTDTLGFAQVPTSIGYDVFEFSTTYKSLLLVLQSSFPIMHFTGSRVIEIMETVFPAMMGLGWLGIALSLFGALLRPGVLTRSRLTALILAAFYVTIPSQGGYSLIFLLFFVFFEPWRGFGRGLALGAAYVWCFPLDLDVSGLSFLTTTSFLTNRIVDVDLPITLGQLGRPALVLLIEYGLVFASISDILARGERWPFRGRGHGLALSEASAPTG